MSDKGTSATICLFLYFIATCEAFYFTLTSQTPVCFKLKGHETYTIEYASSGEHNDKVKMQIVTNGLTRLQQENVTSFGTQYTFQSRVGFVCFETSTNTEKRIVADFQVVSNSIQNNIIDSEDILAVAKSLSRATRSMRGVGVSLEEKIEQDEVNKGILQESEKKIQIAGIIKIVFLISSAIVQLCIGKSFLKANQGRYSNLNTVSI